MRPSFHLAVSAISAKFSERAPGTSERLAPQPPKPPTVGESQSLQDQQFEERLRIAERLVQALRETGYSSRLAEDIHVRAYRTEKTEIRDA